MAYSGRFGGTWPGRVTLTYGDLCNRQDDHDKLGKYWREGGRGQHSYSQAASLQTRKPHTCMAPSVNNT